MKEKLNKFSVPLGLLDYGNPICYAITTFVIFNNLDNLTGTSKTIFLIGAILSLIFGLIIPTGKVLVGLEIISFKMPVSLVFLVNAGILISGLTLFKTIINPLNLIFIIIIVTILILLILIYLQSKKINTIAVLTGAFGYLLIYTSLITLSIRNHMIIPVILYIIAICLFIMLCGIGIKANLKNPKVHWVIEISNVICQLSVTIATIILLSNK